MATIRNLRPGQVVYSVMKTRQGATMLRRQSVYQVSIVEIDPEGKWVLASWNNNAPRRYYANVIAGWRVKKPESDARNRR